jgi:hypothetical protein
VAAAATAPVSGPQIVAHFSLSAGQSPEDMALEPGGAVDISLASASTGVRVTRGGHVELPGQLPRSGNCPVLGAPFSAGIARAVTAPCTWSTASATPSTGIWRLRRDSAPTQIAQLPAKLICQRHDVGRAEREPLSDRLGAGRRVEGSRGGGTPTIWATGPAPQKTSFFGANGIDVHPPRRLGQQHRPGHDHAGPDPPGRNRRAHPHGSGETVRRGDNFRGLGKGNTIVATLVIDQ